MDRLWAMAVFVRVAECGSFSRAAESLDLANATVTTCIRNLERNLEVTLIHRDTRRLHLTEEGGLYLVRAKEVLRLVEDTESEVQARLGQLRGPLNVEIPISIGHALVCPALADFAARYPGIATAVTLTNQPHHLIERAIDVAIRMDRVEDADLIARPIYETHYKVCCTANMAATLPAHPDALDPAVCLGILSEERRSSNAWKLSLGAESVTINPQGPLHFNSSDALVVAACQGAGVVHLLDIFVNQELASGKLVQIYPEWTTAAKTFYAVTTKSRATSAKVRAFTDFLTEVLESQGLPRSDRAVEVRAIGKR
jgi:LysR family transcriptional regulator, regulator for bpeEF and oprC